MSEMWRSVPGWEGRYEVSDMGRVKSLARTVGSRWPSYRREVGESVLTPTPNSWGYLHVRLCDGAATRSALVHRLVLEAFIGPCPEGMEGCHNDGDKRNNSLSNLRWDTSTANQLDKVRHGRHHNAAKTECVNGHPFDAANTYITPKGARQCRTCRSAARSRHENRKAKP